MAAANNHEDYESFMNELEILADINGLDLHVDRYNYHTYFMRGWEPQGVVDDIKSLDSTSSLTTGGE